MRQDRDETIRSFAARLRGQASVCKFSIECITCQIDVHYSDEMVKDALIRGIVDHDIQLDLLGERDQDMALEAVVSYVEAKEAGKRSSSRLVDAGGASASSSYRQQQKTISRAKTGPDPSCTYCGQNGHGLKSTPAARRRSCPAYGHTCSRCGVKHHMASVCRSRKTEPNDDTTNSSFLCTVFQNGAEYTNDKIMLDHHVYDNLNDAWVKATSKPHPFVSVDLEASSSRFKITFIDFLST